MCNYIREHLWEALFPEKQKIVESVIETFEVLISGQVIIIAGKYHKNNLGTYGGNYNKDLGTKMEDMYVGMQTWNEIYT